MEIRKAVNADLSRIAEIYVYNNRVNYLPIFKDPAYSFGELQVVPLINNYFKKKKVLNHLYVYDDGLIKGFVLVQKNEIDKLYVDTFFQGNGIGYALLKFAVDTLGANTLWALEKNERAISFYKKHNFALSGERKPEEGTEEYLVELKLEKAMEETINLNYTYMVRCCDGTLYTGWTNHLEERIRTHNEGNGAKYTRSRRPVELVYWEVYKTKQEAMSREVKIKRLSRKEKEELIQRKWKER